ncbi:MAG: endonuclease/exonuclease/phosphatase family protein [Saprospiraceae bacterium]
MYLKFICTIVIITFYVFFGVSSNSPFYKPKPYLKAIKSYDEKVKLHDGLIEVLSYNTWGLPIALDGHDQDRRFNVMGYELASINSEIIALQETFHSNLRQNILQTLGKTYYHCMDYSKNRNLLGLCHMDYLGGLMTFSKYPILEEKFYPFPDQPNSKIIELIGRKGFLISKIQFGDIECYIVNTHLYAGSSANDERHRKAQIEFLFRTLKELDIINERIILVGDFNIQHPCLQFSEVYQIITETHHFEDSKPIINENDFTYNCRTNAYVPNNENKSKLDYIFLSRRMQEEFTVRNQGIEMNSPAPCSDHYGWKATLKLNTRFRNSSPICVSQ